MTVVVDVNERVVEVRLAAEWRSRFGPKSLGMAILEAKDVASFHYATLCFAADDSGNGTVLPPLLDEPHGMDRQRQLSIEDMVGLLFDYANKRDAYSRDLSGLYEQDREIVNAGGWVTARVKGPAIVAIEFDRDWFRSLSAVTISDSIVDLFARAQQSLNDTEDQLLQRYPAVSRLLTRTPL